MPTKTDKRKDSDLLAKRTAQVQGGAARAAVLGVNDGLVSTVCIVLVVAAATNGNQLSVLIAGFAGLVAGAFSMAAGEWISIKSQVELFEGILDDLKLLVKRDMALLRETLADTLHHTGMSKKSARAAAQEMSKKEDHFREVYAMQVLGMNPDELGSPWVAAGSSFALFTLGALASLSPWFFVGGTTAAILSVLFTALASLVVGAYIARTSGKNLWYGALRQMVVVLLASVVTYGIGYAFGIVVS